MLNVNVTLLAIIASAAASLAQPEPGDLGQSLALVDDSGVNVLTWDGEVARFYRAGHLELEYESDSWADVMWNVDVPAYGNVTSPHRYDRALTVAEIDDLESCDWANDLQVVECGLDARCDCGDQPTLAGTTSAP